MKPVILFRSDNSDDANQEMEIAMQHFPVYRYRSQIPDNSLVIGRYSVLPYYRELEKDLNTNRSKLINTPREHEWIAEFDYYHDMKEFTPKSWTEHEFPYSNYQGPLVIKGRTNSRKSQWSTKMYAKDRQTGIKVAAELATDPLIGPQGLIYRQYVPLKTLGRDEITGIPWANEWRIFLHQETILSAGYYWSSAPEEVHKMAELSPKGLELIASMAPIATQCATFYIMDIAETEAGDWILIEMNDGQMGGLSENDPNKLYSALKNRLCV